ncbi:hypothetical protein J2129_001870 [Methanofollis sp. W23]|uniref:SMI1/KNR4 family protein n=1 Tax=Methanofollis sp. W23 TaxID=2817849 RepID=UPI001AE1A013|nr:SMI1/KNR4 family protein [Methanofollis sp. W23]MBP2146416.1 hypothetical protein [Methanofollis sp. W23]
MFKIVWDKEEVKQEIRSREGGRENSLGFWTPVQVFVNGLDITGLEEVPKGHISLFDDIFLSFFYVFYSLDPDHLQEKKFHMISNVKNNIDGGSFDLYVFLNKESDIVSLKYRNFVHPEYHIVEIPLKQFAEGILQSASEMLEEVLRIAPELEDDENYVVLKEDMDLIRNWYQERYEKTTNTLNTSIERKPLRVKEGRIRWIGVEGADDEEMIECVQKILDITFPDDYLSYVKKYPHGFPYPYNMIVDKEIRGGNSQFVNFLSFNPKDSVSYILNSYYAINRSSTGFNRIVPFAQALYYDLLCFDYRENFPPQIVYREYHKKGEEKPPITLCESFTELLGLMKRCE